MCPTTTAVLTPIDAESYLVLIPILDDWDSLRELLPMLDREFKLAGLNGRILLIDDGSQISAPSPQAVASLQALTPIEVLHLRRNLGHQRAIAIGLAYIAEHIPCAGVVVMDADGEDRPADVPRLIEAMNRSARTRAVFAKRIRRSEGFSFRVSYWLFRILHKRLTGIPVEVGNFSALPLPVVRRLAAVTELWNHYAAAVVQARIPRELLPTSRGARLAGRSRMSFVALVIHGLSAISVFADRIGVRLLLGSVLMGSAALIGILVVVAVRLTTDLAIPGWATTTIGILAILLAQAVVFSLVFTLAIQFGRSTGSFLPARDYVYFVDTLERILPDGG